jgi:hypothetical protein
LHYFATKDVHKLRVNDIKFQNSQQNKWLEFVPYFARFLNDMLLMRCMFLLSIYGPTYEVHDTPLMTYINSYIFRQSFRSQRVITVKVYKPTYLTSAPLYRKDLNLQMLKYIKLINTNYRIMTLNIKICNNEQPHLPDLSCFYTVCWMYTNIGLRFLMI